MWLCIAYSTLALPSVTEVNFYRTLPKVFHTLREEQSCVCLKVQCQEKHLKIHETKHLEAFCVVLVIACSLMGGYQSEVGTWAYIISPERGGITQIFVFTYMTFIRNHVPEDYILNGHCCENLNLAWETCRCWCRTTDLMAHHVKVV
jgi:hypothetical protein